MRIDVKEVTKKARRRARRVELQQSGRKMGTIVIETKSKKTGRKMKHKRKWLTEYIQEAQ